MSRIATLPTIVVLVATLLACSSPEERFAEHLSRAEKFAAEERTEEALLELQSALKLDPRSAEVNERLGVLLSEQGADRPAIFHLGEAYRLDPNRVDAATRQIALTWGSSPRRAVQIMTRVKRDHPEDSRVYRTEAALSLVRKDVVRAEEAARKAIELAPEVPANWVQLGAVHLGRIREMRERGEDTPDAEFEGALAAYRKVDELAEGHMGARLESARVYGAWRGHRGEAVAAFRSAIELAAERGTAEQRLAAANAMVIYAQRNNSKRLRLEALRHLVDAQPTRVRSWERLAQASAQGGGPEAAEAVFRELLESHPELPGAHIAFTTHLARRKLELDAIAHLDRVITGDLDIPILWEQLIQVEISARRFADARASYAELVERHPDDPITRRSEARLAIASGRPAEAVEILRGFVGGKESPESERLHALAELQQGHLEDAVAAVDRSIALSPSFNPSAIRLKATIHAEAREWTRAQRALKELTAGGQPLAPSEKVIRIRALYAQEQTEAAREELVQLLDSPFAPAAAALVFARREGRESPKQTRRYLSQALNRAPGNFALLEAMTRLDLRTQKAPRALARLDRNIESRAAGPRILLLRAEILARTGELERAEADALRAFEAAPELPRAVDLLFAIYKAQGKLDEARRSFEEAESVGVLHVGARVLLGRLYLSRGETEKAREMYERVIEQNPDIAPAKNDLAFLLATDGSDLDRALELAEQAQRALPESPNTADTVGFVYYRKGQHEAALQQFRYALQQVEPDDPARATYHYHLGLALASLARHADAASQFEQALAADASFPGAPDARTRLERARQAEAPTTGAG